MPRKYILMVFSFIVLSFFSKAVLAQDDSNAPGQDNPAEEQVVPDQQDGPKNPELDNNINGMPEEYKEKIDALKQDTKKLGSMNDIDPDVAGAVHEIMSQADSLISDCFRIEESTNSPDYKNMNACACEKIKDALASDKIDFSKLQEQFNNNPELKEKYLKKANESGIMAIDPDDPKGSIIKAIKKKYNCH